MISKSKSNHLSTILLYLDEQYNVEGYIHSRSYSFTPVVIGLTRTILFQTRIVLSTWLDWISLDQIRAVIVALRINRRVIVGIWDLELFEGGFPYQSLAQRMHSNKFQLDPLTCNPRWYKCSFDKAWARENHMTLTCKSADQGQLSFLTSDKRRLYLILLQLWTSTSSDWHYKSLLDRRVRRLFGDFMTPRNGGVIREADKFKWTRFYRIREA